jgi:hypothetical protein
MTTLQTGFGLEEIARETFLILIDKLNGELLLQEAAWEQNDRDLAARRGIAYSEITLEEIPLNNFHLGNEPSLITDETPMLSYPSVSVMAYRAQPDAIDDFDQAANYRDNLYVETVVKSSPVEGPEVCDRRIWRTAESINNVIMRNRTLNGIVSEIDRSPTCIVSEVFKRPQESDHGEDWYWQAARIEYGVTKLSPFEY